MDYVRNKGKNSNIINRRINDDGDRKDWDSTRCVFKQYT